MYSTFISSPSPPSSHPSLIPPLPLPSCPLPPHLSAEKSKLEREVRVCRMLRHEAIVRLHYVFKEDSINYLLFDL